jgi:hypothetical protein
MVPGEKERERTGKGEEKLRSIPARFPCADLLVV